MTDKENFDKQIELFDILYEKYQENSHFYFTLPNLSATPQVVDEPYFFYRPSKNQITVSFWDCRSCRMEYEYISNKLLIYSHPLANKFIKKILSEIFPSQVEQLSLKSSTMLILGNYSTIKEFIANDKRIIDELLKKELSKQQDIGLDFLDESYFRERLYWAIEIKKRADNRKLAGNIRLKRLILTEIGHFSQEVRIDFSQRITCIIGENGSGKSTILRALSLVLCGVGNNGFLKEEYIWKNDFLRITGYNVEFGFQFYAENAFISLDYELFNTDSKKGFLQKIIFDQSKGFNQIKNWGDFANLVNSNHFKTLTIGFPQVQGKNEKYLNTNFLNTQGNIKDILPLILNEADNRFEEFSKWLIQLYATGNQQKANGVINPSSFQIIETIFSIISAITGSLIAFLSVNHESETVWVTTDDAPEGIPLSLISQGYNNVFGWIGFLVKRLAETNPNSPDFTKEPAMVFIDEIDTYLHPEWQRTILRVLVDTFTATQFVITTHSFAVATSVPDIKIYRLEKQSNHTIICKEFTDYKPYGMDANDALVQLMDTPNRAAKDANEDINRLFELIENDALEEAKAELALLTEKYDRRDNKLVEAEMLIHAKELLAL